MAAKKNKKPVKKTKRPGVYRVSRKSLEEMNACWAGLAWFARYILKRRKYVTVTADEIRAKLEELRGHPQSFVQWFADKKRLSHTYHDGYCRNFVGRNFAGYRSNDGSGRLDVDGQTVYWRSEGYQWPSSFPVPESQVIREPMPESLNAVVRAARQRLRAQGGAGVVSGQPTAS